MQVTSVSTLFVAVSAATLLLVACTDGSTGANCIGGDDSGGFETSPYGAIRQELLRRFRPTPPDHPCFMPCGREFLRWELICNNPWDPYK